MEKDAETWGVMKRWQVRIRIAARRAWRDKRRTACFAGAVMLFISALCWGEGVPGRAESWNSVWHYPVLDEALHFLESGRLPFWNSRLGFGYPVWAAEGALLANPLAWPLLSAGPSALLQALVLTSALVALGAFFLFARRNGFHTALAVPGAVVYAGNGYLVAQLFSGGFETAVVAGALPLASLLVSSRSSRTNKWLLGLILGSWAIVGAGLSGLVLLLLFVGLVEGVLRKSFSKAFLMDRRWADARTITAFFCLLIVPIFVGAAVLLPEFELWLLSVPAPPPSAPPSAALPLSSAIELFIPSFFGGGEVPRWAGNVTGTAGLYASWLVLLPFVIWPAASPVEKRQVRHAAFLAAGALGVAMIGSVFPVSRLASLFPETAAVLRLSRFAAVAMFALSWMVMVCAGVAFRRFPEVRRRALLGFSAAAAACLTGILMLSVLGETGWRPVFARVFAHSEFQTLLGAGYEPEFGRRWNSLEIDQVVAWLAPRALDQARAALFWQGVIATLWALLFWSVGRWRRLQHFLPGLFALAATLDLIVGSRHLRDWTLPARLHPPAVLRDVATDARLAVAHLPFARNSILLEESGEKALFPATVPRVPRNAFVSSEGNPFLSLNAAQLDSEAIGSALRQLVAFGATHVILPPGKNAPALAGNESGPGEVQSENDTVAPLPGAPDRVWSVGEIVAVEGRDTVVARLGRPDFNWRTTAVATEVVELPAGAGAERFQFTGRVSAEPPNRLEVRAWSSAPSALVMSEATYPGWKATVNNRPARIFEANGWLRAVVLREGTSFVRLRFEPFSFRLGLFLSFLAGSVWAGLAMKYFAGRRRRP